MPLRICESTYVHMPAAPAGIGLGGRLEAELAAEAAATQEARIAAHPAPAPGGAGREQLTRAASGGVNAAPQQASGAASKLAPLPADSSRAAGEMQGPDAFSARAAASTASAGEALIAGPGVQSSGKQAAASRAADYQGGQQQNQRLQRHYWGQALQHLDRAAEVEAGSRLTLLAKRDGGTIRFSLRVQN